MSEHRRCHERSVDLRHALGVGLLVLACAVAPNIDSRLLAAESDIYRGRRLTDVLREMRDRGLELVFSSAVVGRDLRITIEPTASDPRTILDQVLRPLRLEARDGPSGSILILPASPGDVEADDGADDEPRRSSAFVTEVVVTPSRHSVVREEQSAVRSIGSEEVLLAPSIGGDLTRLIELLPGVAAADNSAAFNVRGSVASDVAFVLDGLELYDPFHLQSFHSPFSLIDNNVVDRIDFFGGGFTADLGDRNGGFVEISTVTPEDTDHGEIEVGTLNSRFSYRSPGADGGAAWLISARGWYPEAWLDTTELGAGEEQDPRFGDLYGKVAFNAGQRHRLSAHGLMAYDRLKYTETGEEINEEIDALTRNGYVWLRAISAWAPGVTSETVWSGGRIERIRDGKSGEDEPLLVDDDREVDFFGLKHDAIWQISDRHALKSGADVRRLDAKYRYSNRLESEGSESESIRIDPDGTSLGAYLAYRWRMNGDVATELGLRWDRQGYTRDNQLSPRFNALWRAGARTELRLALGRFNQSQRIHELHVEDGETEFSRAEVSEQVELSFRRALGAGLHLRVDAYYRELSKIRPRYENLFEPIELFPETNPDRVLVAPDEARLQGIELLLRGDIQQPLFWWVSYTLSSAEDRIDGDDIPRAWDQTHAGKFLIGYRRQGRWSVSMSGNAHTGWPTTPVTGELTKTPGEEPEETLIPGERNSDRFADYFRLDLKARRAFTPRHGKVWLTVEVLNATDRDNACCLNEFIFEESGDGEVNVRREFDYWLGITPAFNVLWEF